MIKKVLLSLLFGLFLSISEGNATSLDKNHCSQYGSAVENIALIYYAGASYNEILDLLNNPDFYQNPQDIQILIKTTVLYMGYIFKLLPPEEHAQGAIDFCMRLNGDVEKMNYTIQKALGTEI